MPAEQKSEKAGAGLKGAPGSPRGTGERGSATGAPLPPALPRYSRFVSLLKFALPLAALAIVVTVVIYSVMYRPDTTLAISYSKIENDEGRIVMLGPRFVGSDKDNRPFEVLAKSASQDPETQSLVDLEEIDARMGFAEEDLDMSLKAKHGRLDTDNQILRLEGPITLTASNGYVIETMEALADLKNGKLTGQTPITASGPAGTITAEAFEANRKEKTLRFTRNVRIRFYPTKEEDQ